MSLSASDSRVRKWVIWIAVFAAVAGLITLVFMDERPPDVGDLMPQRVAIPDEQNALPLLVKAVALLVNADDISPARAYKNDTLLLRKLLAENQPALALLDEAMLRPALEFEEVTSFSQTFPYLTGLMRLSQLEAARARVQFEDGQQSRALSELAGIAEFGMRIEEGGGALIHWLVGVSVKAVALDEIARRLPEASLSSTELRSLDRRLEVLADDHEALRRAVRAEYRPIDSIVELTASDPNALANLGMGGFAQMRLAGLGRLAFKPNRTRRMFAEGIREVSAAAAHPYAQFAERTPLYQRATNKPHPLLLLASSNATGNILFHIAIPVYESVVERKSRITTQLSMTRALIALRCLWLDHGTLPERLDDLVPEYLPTVPRDDYDGQPLRYSREKRVLYSIGKDFIDSGGASDPEDNKQKKTEPTIRLDWAL